VCLVGLSKFCTRIARSAAVGVLLIGVCYQGTIVTGIANSVTVTIGLIRIIGERTVIKAIRQSIPITVFRYSRLTSDTDATEGRGASGGVDGAKLDRARGEVEAVEVGATEVAGPKRRRVGSQAQGGP